MNEKILLSPLAEYLLIAFCVILIVSAIVGIIAFARLAKSTPKGIGFQEYFRRKRIMEIQDEIWKNQ